FFVLLSFGAFPHLNEVRLYVLNLVRTGSLTRQASQLHFDELPSFNKSLESRLSIHSQGKRMSQKTLAPANKCSLPPPYAYKTRNGKSLESLAHRAPTCFEFLG